jgi:hypothetical protein
MVDKQGEELYSEQIRAGSRMYFFDALKASTGAMYLKVSESRMSENRRHEHHRVMVFEEHLPAFAEGLRRALEFLAPKKRPEDERYAEIRKRYPRAYEKWTAEEDARLKREFEREKSVEVLARRFQRQPGCDSVAAREARLVLPSHKGAAGLIPAFDLVPWRLYSSFRATRGGLTCREGQPILNHG